MTPYENKKPRYVREWYVKLKQRMKKLREKKLRENALEQQQLAGSPSQITTPGKQHTMTRHTTKTEEVDDDDSYGREKDDQS